MTANPLFADSLQPAPGEQIATSVAVETGGDESEQVEVPFLLYAPQEYTSDGEPWPLVLFLHGLGESGRGGDELQRVAIHGPPKLAKQGRQFPFVLVSPQCPPPQERGGVRIAWRPEVLLALLDKIEADLNIDTSRIYVTGLSMGGFGTWRLAAAAPERFAAAAPICGGGEPAAMAPALALVPVWAFHGAKDGVVPLERSTEMVEAIRTAGGRVFLTVYPDAGHDSWTATYDNPMLYDWLLGHRRD